MNNFIETIGKKTLEFLIEVGEFVIFFLKVLGWVFKGKWKFKNIFAQMDFIGVGSIPIVILTSAFTGMVLAIQTGYQFMKVGSTMYLGAVVGLAITREIGPVLTSIVVAGRVGSSIAAEIGTMAVTEQIDALKSLAVNPIQYLATPRFIASILILPILCIFSDIIGMIGGLLVGVYNFNINPALYIQTSFKYLGPTDISIGLLKTSVFGMIISIVGCFFGFKAKGGAEGVGKVTTISVVTSAILILIADYYMAIFLFLFGF